MPAGATDPSASRPFQRERVALGMGSARMYTLLPIVLTGVPSRSTIWTVTLSERFWR